MTLFGFWYGPWAVHELTGQKKTLKSSLNHYSHRKYSLWSRVFDTENVHNLAIWEKSTFHLQCTLIWTPNCYDEQQQVEHQQHLIIWFSTSQLFTLYRSPPCTHTYIYTIHYFYSETSTLICWGFHNYYYFILIYVTLYYVLNCSATSIDLNASWKMWKMWLKILQFPVLVNVLYTI